NGADPNLPANNVDRNGRSVFIAEHGGIAGSSWDLYRINGSDQLDGGAGSLGSRDYAVFGSNSLLGPSLDMLRFFYKMIVFLSAGGSPHVMGPYCSHGQDDT